MEPISCRTPRPGRTNRGRMKSPASRRVSRTISRSSGVRRSRRGRAAGKPGDGKAVGWLMSASAAGGCGSGLGLGRLRGRLLGGRLVRVGRLGGGLLGQAAVGLGAAGVVLLLVI